MHGLSLSFCIKDILNGDIPEELVESIRCGFQWDGKVDESYYDIYWSKWGREEVDALISRLDIKPCYKTRKPGDDYWSTLTCNIAHGHWIVGICTINRIEDWEDRLPTNVASLLANRIYPPIIPNNSNT